MNWITENKHGVVVSIHATPKSSRNAVQGLHGEALKVRLRAPPVDGKANEALVEFLAGAFGIPAGRVAVLTGHAHRQKRVAIQGVTADHARRILMAGITR